MQREERISSYVHKTLKNRAAFAKLSTKRSRLLVRDDWMQIRNLEGRI